MKRKRIAILQRVCTSYRQPLFAQLSEADDLDLFLLFGDDLPNSKVKSAAEISGLNYRKLPTWFVRFTGRQFVVHRALIKTLREYKPDLILCEGESNFLNYLKAIVFIKIYARNTPIIQWTLGGLPMDGPKSQWLLHLKRILRTHFDGFLVYSSFGKQYLIDQGVKEENIFVAVNVSDTDKHLAQNNAMCDINNPRSNHGSLQCLFVGSVDADKRIDLLIDAAQLLAGRPVHFTIVGDGAERARLAARAERLGLKNIEFKGRVVDTLSQLYKKSDLMVLPGRGGMVISEAMCYGLPVLAIAADGTEVDLVRPNSTGLLLSEQSGKAIASALATLCLERSQLKRWGVNAKQLIESEYNTQSMSEKIIRCIRWATAKN